MTNPQIPGSPLPGDVNAVDRIVSTAPIMPGEQKVPTGQAFSSFMQEGKGSSMAVTGKTAMISPFELQQGTPLATSSPTLDTLMTQVKNAQGTLGDLSTNLSTPNLKLKSSQKYLLKNKLTDANTQLRATNAKLGAEIPNEPDPSKFNGPLGKFFQYITDGQQQLESAQSQLQGMKDGGKDLKPGDFLLIQVKLNRAQQLIEYSSVLLSNSVGAIKQLMQVQL